MNIPLAEIIFGGRIPFLSFIKKVILFLAPIPLAGIFLFPADFRNLGDLSWGLLIAVLVVRPLGDIFVDFKIFRGLLALRKEVGILCGMTAIAHSIGYFFDAGISPLTGFLEPYIWDVTDYFFWGVIAFFIAVLLTLTSNLFSMKRLKKWWKRLHRLTYILFFTVSIHIVLIKYSHGNSFFSGEVLQILLPVLILSVLWTLSALDVTFSFKKTNE